MKKQEKLVFGLLFIITVIGIVLPIFFYWRVFQNFELSKNPADWGTFGDYFGGVLNPAISLCSLFLLGYLTYILSQQNSAKTKQLFVLERRMMAYSELTEHVKETNMVTEKVTKILVAPNPPEYYSIEKQHELLYEKMEKFDSIVFSYSEFYNSLLTFKVRYSHLFKYNFDSEDFKKLIEGVLSVKESFSGVTTKILKREALNLSVEKLSPSQNYGDSLVRVINSLRKEIVPG
ncbi:MAG: hypothetical protein Roseis2KO_03280 [Roseivirga sp.]